MKLLVLGAGGMAGHVVAARLAEKGHEVTGLARRKPPFCETIVCDIEEADTPELVRGYDAVVNCIGILNKAVDANPSRGIYLNACLPHALAAHAKRVVHLSTDCVFSGHDGGSYEEKSFRSADTLYGRSKALGELDDDRNLTFRTSIVGPETKEDGVGLFHWFMKQSGEVQGYAKAIWSGVTTIALADAIHAALSQNLTGLYHLTNGERISKLELLRLFDELRETPASIVPSDAPDEDRSLIDTRKSLDFVVPPYREMVRDMGTWIRNHAELYEYVCGKENSR